MSPNWYDLLGVDRDASTDEIRRAWKAGIADLDPTDRRFQLLNKAAGVLLDRDERTAYDATLEPEEDLAADDLDDLAADESDDQDADESDLDGRADTRAADDDRTADTDDNERERSGLAGWAVPSWLLALLLVGAVVAAGAAFAVQRQTTSPDELEANVSAARTAAEKAVPRVLTYDYRYPERDHDRAMQVLSGGVADRYEKIWQDAILPNLVKVKGTATTQALGSGVVRASEDGDQVEVVVVITTRTTNQNVTTQVPAIPMTVKMIESDDEWKIADMDLWAPDSSGADEPDATTSPGQDSSKKSGKKSGNN